MAKLRIPGSLLRYEQIPMVFFLLRWILFSVPIGLLVGSASAILLISLQWATDVREGNRLIMCFLPLAGLVIGLLYHYWGGKSVRGNNYLIDEIHDPKDIIPFRMAPLVYISTVITHLFGGSAGREGTAVQMGGALADQFSKILRLRPRDHKMLVIMGISGGFASVFGTPIAGAVFALEVIVIGRMRYEAILPSFLVAASSNYVCNLWGVQHTHYSIGAVPGISVMPMLYVILCGIAFGMAAMTFSRLMPKWSGLFSHIKYPPLRPFVGGIVIVISVFLLGTTKYVGLGVPTIVESFTVQQDWYVFLIKILLTTFTLGVGFKGGEVTPLFFIGATLGSALSVILPLPVGFLAAIGFVAVFAGATNTPLASSIMGIELFGAEAGLYIALGCVVSYMFSGHTGIYSSQIIGSPKHLYYGLKKGETLKH